MYANKLAECLRPVADKADAAHVELGPVRIMKIGEKPDGAWAWYVQSNGGDMTVEMAADLAAMHLIRRLNAEGWVPRLCLGHIDFWDGRVDQQEPYTKHPIEALAKFAASRKVGG